MVESHTLAVVTRGDVGEYPRPGQIGDRKNLPLLPKDGIGKSGNIAHVNTGTDDTPALVQCLECGRHKTSDGREDDRGIQHTGRAVAGAS